MWNFKSLKETTENFWVLEYINNNLCMKIKTHGILMTYMIILNYLNNLNNVLT